MANTSVIWVGSDGCSGVHGGGGEKWVCSEHVLEIELMGLSEGLEMGKVSG